MMTDEEIKQAVSKELSGAATDIVLEMLERLKATPFDGRTKAAFQMLDDSDLMAGHRAEVESFLKRHYYWNQ